MQVTKELKRLLCKAQEIIVYFNPTNEPPNGIAKDWTKRSVTLDLYFIKRPRTNVEVTKVEDKSGAQYRVQLQSKGQIRSGYHDQAQEASYPTGHQFSKYSDDKSNIYNPRKGAWVFLHAPLSENLRGILKTLPINSTLEWRVRLDNNNHYCTANNLHADELHLEIRQENKIVTRLVDYIITQDNSARFGYEF